MRIIDAIAPAVLVAAVALAPLPASAQGRGRENGERRGRAVERGSQGRHESRAPEYRRDGEHGRYAGGGHAAPRREFDVPRGGRVYHYSSPRYYAPLHHGSRWPRFERPYYAFRPHTHIGFGLWLGFGVPYPTAFVAAYPPPVYGYYGGGFGVVPGARVYGGVSFDIAPAYAPVYVDGAYVGVASDFGPYAQPLTLVPGVHRVMVSVGGYRPVSWSVNVVAGQVVPFHGTLVAP